MSLSKQVKTALDETRLLMLGAQVLFGFQLNGVFQEEFANLSLASRYVDCAGQVLMAMAIGLLVAPSMQHRSWKMARTLFVASHHRRVCRHGTVAVCRQPGAGLLHRF